MDYFDLVINAISTLGFPIIVAGALFWYITKKDEQHKDEMKSLKESLDQNTLVLTELKGLINYLLRDEKNESQRN